MGWDRLVDRVFKRTYNPGYMNVTETRTQALLSTFSRQSGAEPLIPIFLDASREGTVQARTLAKVVARAELAELRFDLLVAAAKPTTFKAMVALRDIGHGLALFLVRGSLENVVEHHDELFTDPPLWGHYKDALRRGVGNDCLPDCDTRLYAICETVTAFSANSGRVRTNFYAADLFAGMDEMTWLLNVLQQVNTRGTSFSPFQRS